MSCLPSTLGHWLEIYGEKNSLELSETGQLLLRWRIVRVTRRMSHRRKEISKFTDGEERMK